MHYFIKLNFEGVLNYLPQSIAFWLKFELGLELDIIEVKSVLFLNCLPTRSWDVSCFAAARRSQAAGPGCGDCG